MHTAKQARQLLTLAEDKDLASNLFQKVLEFFAAVLLAAKLGKLPSLTDFQKFLGLNKETPFLCELTSDGRSPEKLIADIQSKDRKVWDWAENVMTKGKDKFPVVTNGVNYRLGVIFGCEFEDSERTNENIFAEIERRKVAKPHAEVAPLLRDKFTQAELLKMVNALRPAESPEITWVIVMHEPIRVSDGDPGVLGLDRDVSDDDLDAYLGYPGDRWDRDSAFVVLLPQVQA